MASPVVVALVAMTTSRTPPPFDHALEQLGDVQVLGIDPVDRRQRAAEHVVAAVELAGALDRDHVARLLDHADHGGLAALVLADPAGGLGGEVEADLALADGLLDLADRVGERERLLLGDAQDVEGEPLGGALPDAGQAGELGDQAVDRRGEQGRSSVALVSAMPSAIVIGAGVFGASLADRLAREGWEVTLVERFEPGNTRAESGGETRLIRCSARRRTPFYARSARRALALWRELGEELLVESGMAWFARREDGWEADSERVLRAAGIPVERLAPEEGARLFPGRRRSDADLAFVLHEPEAGRSASGRRGARAGRSSERGAGLGCSGPRLAPTAPRWSGPAERGSKPTRSSGPAAPGWPRLFPRIVVRLRVPSSSSFSSTAPPGWSGPGWVDFDAAFYGHARVGSLRLQGGAGLRRSRGRP